LGGEWAPYPFTTSEIRAGCPYGRTIEYRVEAAGSPPVVERWTFAPVDRNTVRITTEHYDAQGSSTGAPTTETATWSELHEHARFPRDATTISNEPCSTPAGEVDCMHYMVTKGDEVKSLWFARRLPGPPVRLEVVKGGQPQLTMTMQANRMKAATTRMP
jgi:hypothetical protein